MLPYLIGLMIGLERKDFCFLVCFFFCDMSRAHLLLFSPRLQEDEMLIAQVAMHGDKNWATVSRAIPNRNGKQCRERLVLCFLLIRSCVFVLR